MRILILSCGTGGGHNTAGYAVVEEMRRRGHQVCFEDAFGLVGKPAAKIVDNTYIKTVQYAPKAFGAMYSISETFSKQVPGESAAYWANSVCAHALKKYLTKHTFDAVVMTHLFAAHMMTALRKHGFKTPPCYLIATDYTCYPFLRDAKCDYFVIPSPELAPLFVENGVHASKILPYGIPVKRHFSKPITKEEACKAIGLSAEHEYIVLSGGSIGASSMTDCIKALLTFLEETPQAHLVVICGSNERLYEKLLQNFAGNKQIHIIGRTDQMPQYLHACRLFITKPGGLSTTEAAVSCTPMILMPPIPGCETHNIEFFSSHNMCLAVENIQTDLLPAIQTLFQTEAAIDMQQAQRASINANSTRDLCDHIEKHTTVVSD